MRPIVEANPQVIDYKEQLAVSYNMAGDLARQLGRIDAAGDFAVKARDLMEALQRADPTSTRPSEALSKALNNLGRYHAAKGRRAGALTAYRRSIEVKLAKPSDVPKASTTSLATGPSLSRWRAARPKASVRRSPPRRWPACAAR